MQVQACGAAEAVSAYVPGPVSVGPEIYAGALAGVIPFAIGSWEFGKRIVRSLLLTPRSYQLHQESLGVFQVPGSAPDSACVVADHPKAVRGVRRQRPRAEGALLPQVPRVRRLFSVAGVAQVLHVHGRARQRRASSTAAGPDICALQVSLCVRR